MTTDPINQRLQRCEADLAELITRVARLETHHNAPNEPARETTKPPSATKQTTPTTTPPEVPPTAQPATVSLPQPTPTANPARPANNPPNPPTDITRFERIVGRKLYSWIGAIFIFAGAMFFLKLAYDHGWFALLNPATRCILTALAGAALITLGECARQRWGPRAAIGLTASGLATLYGTALASFHLFNLIPQSLAFAACSAVAALGITLTVRGRSLTLGVLALLGGYAAPILLGGQPTFDAALPAYLSTLLAIALGVAWRIPELTRLLYPTFIFHAALSALWLAAGGRDQLPLALGFHVAWWFAFQFIAAHLSRRAPRDLAHPALSFIATAWLVATAILLLQDHAHTLGLTILTLAAVQSAFALYDHIRLTPHASAAAENAELDWEDPPSITEIFINQSLPPGIAILWLQVVALLATAIGFELGGAGRLLAWTVLGFASIEAGRRTAHTLFDWLGLGVLVVALVGLVPLPALQPSLLRTVLTAGPFTIAWINLLALVVSGATIAAALRLRPLGTPPRRALANIVFFLSLHLFFALLLTVVNTPAIVPALWTTLAVAAALAPRLWTHLRTVGTAVWLLALTGVFHGFLNVLPQLAATIRPPFFNGAFLSSLLIVAALLFIASQRLTHLAPTARRRFARFVATLGGVYLLIFSATEGIVAARWLRALDFAPHWPDTTLHLWFATAAIALAATALLILARFRRAATLATAAAGIACAVPAVWCIALSWPSALGAASYPALPLLNPGTLVVAILGVCTFAAAPFAAPLLRTRTRTPNNDNTNARILRFTLLAALLFFWGSLQIDHAGARFAALLGNRLGDALMSLYWGVFAILLVAVGFRKTLPAPRYVGLALLGVTILKVLLFDLANVSLTARVLAFFITGLLLVGTSLAYAAREKRTNPPTQNLPPTGGD